MEITLKFYDEEEAQPYLTATKLNSLCYNFLEQMRQAKKYETGQEDSIQERFLRDLDAYFFDY